MEEFVLGELWDFTLNYEEKLNGGIEIWVFLGFCSGSHVEVLRRGGHLVFPPVLLGELFGFEAGFWRYSSVM
jgi:hypothetical protein